MFALTLLGSSGGVATNRSWARATRAAPQDSSLGAGPRARRDHARTNACERGAPGAPDEGGPEASAPHGGRLPPPDWPAPRVAGAPPHAPRPAATADTSAPTARVRARPVDVNACSRPLTPVASGR